MFDGDDSDFSFLDEEFLEDTFKTVDSPSTVPERGKKRTSIPQNMIKSIQKSFVNTEDAGSLSFLEKHNHSGGSAVLDKTKNSTLSVSDAIIMKKEESPTPASDIDFGSDDFFDGVNLDENFDDIGLQNTPPDSEFTENLLLKSRNVHYCEERSEISSQNIGFRKDSHLREPKEKNCILSPKNGHLSNIRGTCTERSGEAESEKKWKRIHSEELNSEDCRAVKRRQILSVNQGLNSEAAQQFQIHNDVDTPSASVSTSFRKIASTTGPVIQKRKFPGPAGILPSLGSEISSVKAQEVEKEESDCLSETVVLSQTSAGDFSHGLWQQMLNDLKQDKPDHSFLLEIFNLKWFLMRAGLRGQACVRKIPFLAVLIHNINGTTMDATVIFKDPTGEMNGTIASSVLQDYGHVLLPGSVLLLRDVTLLSPLALKSSIGGRESTRRLYLNVTLNTILKIYSSDESGTTIRTTICGMDKNDLFKKAAAFKRTTAPRAIVEEEEDEESSEKGPESRQTLFSNACASKNTPGITNQFAMKPNFKNQRYGSNSSTLITSSTNQQQRFPFVSPSNSPRISSPGNGPRSPGMFKHQAGNFSGGRANNLTGTPSRLESSNRNISDNFQRPTLHAIQPAAGSQISQNVLKPSHPQVIHRNSQIVDKPHSNKNLCLSQQEKKEITDLLDGVDANSLFGDF